jgi:hypothetical protein
LLEGEGRGHWLASLQGPAYSLEEFAGFSFGGDDMSGRLWSSAVPLRSVRLGVLTGAGYRPAEGEEQALVWVPTKGAGLESRLRDLAETPRDVVVGAVPGGSYLCHKRQLWIRLARSFGRARAEAIAPPSWIPEVAADRARLLAAHRPGALYLLKKAAVQRRAGITLLADIDATTLDAAQGQGSIIQRMVQDQLEVAGHRCSLRCWVVLFRRAGEVQANLHQEGLLMYAPGGAAPGGTAVEDRWITRRQDGKVGPEGAPERLSGLLAMLRAAGVSPEPLQAGIVRGVKACVSAVLRDLSGAALQDHACVELFGVDFVVDRALKPWLLEWNRMPSLTPRHEDERALREDVWRGSLALGGLPGLGVPDGFLPIGRWRTDPPPPNPAPADGADHG